MPYGVSSQVWPVLPLTVSNGSPELKPAQTKGGGYEEVNSDFVWNVIPYHGHL